MTLSNIPYHDPPNTSQHFIRPRIHALLAQAVKKPLTIVCANMGYGKTMAVYDFTQRCEAHVAWMQFNEVDHISHIWDTYIQAFLTVNRTFAYELRELGFPDTEQKMDRYFALKKARLQNTPFIFIVDDFHLMKSTIALRFVERVIQQLEKYQSVILITRTIPQINISSLMVRNHIYLINEADLAFTKQELNLFLQEQGLKQELVNLKQIYEDTQGWAFVVDFVIRMLKKTPGYQGYVSSVVKQDIQRLIEIEIWDVISVPLRELLLKLSLINHYSIDLVQQIVGEQQSHLQTLQDHNALIQFNNHTHSIHLHPALLDFLRNKQDLLSEKDRLHTLATTARWCLSNNYIVDGLFYYEQIQDYEAIIDALFHSYPQFISEHSCRLKQIFERALESVVHDVLLFPVMHVATILTTGQWQDAYELLNHYESQFEQMGPGEARSIRLGCMSYYRGVLLMLRCTTSHIYDFDQCFEQMFRRMKSINIHPKCWYQHPAGLWTSLVGCNTQGLHDSFLSALKNTEYYLSSLASGLTSGLYQLACGELLFYQANVIKAIPCFNTSLQDATDKEQYEIISRVYLYLMRIAVYQGDYIQFQHMKDQIESLLEHDENVGRYLKNDLSIAWYYLLLSKPHSIPSWLKEPFSTYTYESALENFINQIKVRYFYLTDQFHTLLLYMEDQKERSSIHFGCVELLVFEASILYKLKREEDAFAKLERAFEEAIPNHIIMPFVELGQDMRGLLNAYVKFRANASSKSENVHSRYLEWIKQIKIHLSPYIKHQLIIKSEYERRYESVSTIRLSDREQEVLRYMYEGYSNTMIAETFGLSINTVKSHVSFIYDKLGARNKADVFRIAIERKIL